MSRGVRLARPLYVLGGIAGLDLLARIVPDLLFSGDVLVIPVTVLLTSKLVIDATSLGWFLGWGLLGTAVFLIVPRIFPRQLEAWARGIPARGTIALGSVVSGIWFSALVGQLEQFSGSHVVPPWWTLPATFVAILVLIPVTRALPALGSGMFSERASLFALNQRVSGGKVAGRVTLIVFLAGMLLALVSRLFPVPELLLLTFAAKEAISEFVLSTSSGVSSRKDVAERFVMGLGVVWLGQDAVLGLLYAAFPTFFVLYFDLAVVRLLADPLALGTEPLAVAFVGLTLGGATFGVVVTSVRLVERLPASFLTEYVDTGGQLAEDFDELKPRVPGFMLLPGLLLALYGIVAPKSLVATRYSLSVAPLELGIAALLSGALLVTVLGAQSFPGVEVREYHAAVVSAAVFFTVTFAGIGFAGIGLVDGSRLGASTPVGVGLVFGYFILAVVVAPFAGFELFDSRDTKAGRAAKSSFHRLKSEAGAAIKGYIIVVIIGGIIVSVASFLVPGRILEVVYATAMAPFFFGFVYRVLLMPFYLLELV